MTDKPEYICDICKKYYSSRQSLWVHKKKFHTNINIYHNQIQNFNKYYCKNCNKEFTQYQNRWRHEKTCKVNTPSVTNNIINNITNNIINNDNRKNIVNITFNINKLGDENIDLNNKEIEELFKKYGENITKFIELVNFNKELPENHLFCIFQEKIFNFFLKISFILKK